MSKNPFPLKIVMPGIVTPSQNQIASWLMFARYEILNIKKAYWNTLLFCNAHKEEYKAEPGERRIVHFCSYRPRKIDPGNLVGGMKHLVDSLQKMGLIWRDSEKYFEAKYYQYTDGKDPRTEIIIYLVNED